MSDSINDETSEHGQYHSSEEQSRPESHEKECDINEITVAQANESKEILVDEKIDEIHVVNEKIDEIHEKIEDIHVVNEKIDNKTLKETQKDEQTVKPELPQYSSREIQVDAEKPVDKQTPEQSLEEKVTNQVSGWYHKKFIGGYVDKAHKTEYFHAFTQTLTPHERKAMTDPPKFHRDAQTKFTKNRYSQARKDESTQMTKPGCYISVEKDQVREARKYITAEQHHEMIITKVIKIQCFLRKCQAIRRVKQKRMEKIINDKAFDEKEKKRIQNQETHRRKEIERRLHPKTSKDFEILYNGLENWRIQETKKINDSNYTEPARLTALADLLDQEAILIQKIDRLKINANQENRVDAITNLLNKMASPKQWSVHNEKGGYCTVDTPSTIRARELRDLYNALNVQLISVDERLQILLHVKYTVKEFDCNLTRDIVELIDREGDLLSRGRDAISLEGLRKRIGNLFFHFIETPEFNPEAKSFQKFPDAGQSWKKDQAVYYCRGCTKYLPSTEFYLSTTMKHLGKCKSCTTKENIANHRNDDSCYLELLKSTQTEETLKRNADPATTSNQETPLNSILLLQESDIRYLVDIVWNKQSAISRCKEIDELILTRWIQSQELSPWNCILLTLTEAKNHDQQSDPMNVYSQEFIRRIHARHLVAKQHFDQLPTMQKYFKKTYFEAMDGAFFEKDGGERKKESKRSSKVSSKTSSKAEGTVGDISIVGQVIHSR